MMARPVALGLAVALFAVMQCDAQVPFLGTCPDVKVMPSFDVTKYLGKWFEAERYFAIFEFAGKCVTGNYTVDNDGRISILNRQTSSLTGIQSTIEGEVKLIMTLDVPYWVLDTDYDNYAVVWSCSNFGIFSTRNAWILTRQREPSLEVMERAYMVVDRNAVSRAYFTRTDQKRCPATY
ncbi:hypothetical protein FOCC_FOCC017816 [Frankliniella occidentalis]|nr:hypothetical protein FOCC_FOCC017816 [Frankliniella occidentalis]